MPRFRRHLAAALAAFAVLATYTALSPAALTNAAHADSTIAAVDSDIQISEVESNGGKPDDWIELHNLNQTSAEDLSGWWLQDNDSTDHYDITSANSPGGTVIPAGGYLAFDVSWNYNLPTPGKGSSPQYFGLGAADSARVFDSTGTMVDHVDWTQHADDPISGGGKTDPDATYSRCPGTHGESGWVVTDTDTKAAPNTSCPAPATVDADLETSLHVNEVMANNLTDSSGNQLPDWIEVTNTGTVSQDISGWVLSDDKSSDHDYLPNHTVIEAGDHLAWAVGVTVGTTYASQDPFLGTTFTGKTNKDFGLGAPGDNAALLFPDDAADVDRIAWGSDDSTKKLGSSAVGTTFGRCPDGTGTWTVTFAPTEGATNQCANPADSIVKINEVDTATGVVELENTGSVSADISGWTLKDGEGDVYTVPASTVLTAGERDALSVGSALTFGSSGDSLALLDGSTTADSTSWDHALATSWGRCPDGTGGFTDTHAATDGTANSCGTAVATGYDAIRINEIETNGDPLGDWIELTNVSTSPVNISGMVLADNGGDSGADNGTVAGHSWSIPGTTDDPTDTTTAGNTVLGAGKEVVFYSDTQFGFGLGAPDMARLFTPAHVLVDSTSWTNHESGVTYERCPGAAGAATVFTDSFGDPFVNSWANSPGAANDCLPPIRINEVQANDPTGGHDWVELTNVGNQSVDLTGYVLTDDTDSGHQYVIGGSAGDTTSLAPGAFAAYNVDDKTHPGDFGLGKSGDEVRLYEPSAWSSTTHSYDNSQLVDSFVFENTSSLPDADAQLPATVTLPNGTWPVNSTNATSPMTYARCSDGTSQVVADGTGAWAVTSTPTKGAANQCDGMLTATPWPDTHHGQAVSTDDSVDLGQNMSGLFYVAGATPADDYMWGIENGSSGLPGANTGDPGSLYKLVQNGDGTWGPASGWESGRPVRYLDGQGEPDSEGVTAVHGKVYVASERDNTDDSVSKISVTEVDPNDVTAHSGDPDGDLVGTHEWDLGPVLGPGGTAHTGLNPNDPGDANLGIEGVAFVPDSYLTSAGFVDDTTGNDYDPSDYPDHVAGGVFFVAMEKTGKLYAFVLNSDNTFTWISTSDTGFPTIMDLLWDPAQKALWATCDNTCQGRSSILTMATSGPDQGHFVPMTVNERPTGATQNLNNEGFTEQPATECTSGSKSVFWSDDTDDDNHWLRTAAVDCSQPDPSEVGATVTASVSGTPSASGWYDAPVTVSFTCTDVDAVLNQACPGPVTVDESTGGYVDATLTDTLGETYDARVPAINIDTTPPTLSIDGVTQGATYIGAGPTPTCDASDVGSGVASCKLGQVRTPTQVGIGAVATDNAGNTTRTTVTYRTIPYYVDGAIYKDGYFGIRSGTQHVVEALTTGTTAPLLLGPVRSSASFTGSGSPFVAHGTVDGLHRWVSTITIDDGGKAGLWKIGVSVDGTVHSVGVAVG